MNPNVMWKKMLPEKPKLAWHFVGKTLRGGASIPADGEWLKHKGDMRICARGLHASIKLLDAARYATGTTLCRVECEGVGEVQKDKLVCSKRKIIKRFNSTPILKELVWELIGDWWGFQGSPPELDVYLNKRTPGNRKAAFRSFVNLSYCPNSQQRAIMHALSMTSGKAVMEGFNSAIRLAVSHKRVTYKDANKLVEKRFK